MRTLIHAILILAATQVWAHGEDKPGPHGGVISMPGPFHIELVAVNKREFKAYLLDLEWKNPTVRDSSVELKRGPTAAKCKATGDYFECEFPQSVNLSAPGEIAVTATRVKQKGNSVIYTLPLTKNRKD